jgi:hypothetical protein
MTLFANEGRRHVRATAYDPGMSDRIYTKAETLSRMAERRAELERIVEEFKPDRLEVAGPDGWSAKDHLAHVAAWEKSLLALLNGEDRAEAVGIGRADYESMDTDGINEVIFEAHRSMPLAEVLEDFHSTHQRVLDTVEAMDDADLYMPYSHYQPDSVDDRPVINWVAGNTIRHFDEHIEWMTALLAEV